MDVLKAFFIAVLATLASAYLGVFLADVIKHPELVNAGLLLAGIAICVASFHRMWRTSWIGE